MELFNDIRLFIIFIAVALVCIFVSVILVVQSIKIIKRQIKLYNSITLVKLKTQKLPYWCFAALCLFFIIYLITQLSDVEALEVKLFYELFNSPRWVTDCILAFTFVSLFAFLMFFVVLALAKNAIVDKGVYTNFDFLDWYHVHDYIIDQQKAKVILTSSKHTFFTLSGTTPPFKAQKSDIPKLKFILNKNKNKFSGFSSEKSRWN